MISLIAFLSLRRSGSGRMGDHVRSVALHRDFDSVTQKAVNGFWDRVARVLSLVSQPSALDLATFCERAVSFECFAVAARVGEATLSSLRVIIGEESIPTLTIPAFNHMSRLQHLHLACDFWLDFVAFEQMSPLALPQLRYCKLQLYAHNPALKMLQWFARSRFQRGCELHILAWNMSEEESDALNPLWEAHVSRCIRIDGAALSERSSVMRASHRVDFGFRTEPHSALFSAPKLPEYVRIFVRQNRRGANKLRSIEEAILASGAEHALDLHVRTATWFLWRNFDIDGTAPSAFAQAVQHMDDTLGECGVTVLDEGGHRSCLWYPEEPWPEYADEESEHISSSTEASK
jgi:hypothetical protein